VRVVVIGATGNVGSSLMRLLAVDEGVGSLLGVARRSRRRGRLRQGAAPAV